jgi:predicted S18 family serine protease
MELRDITEELIPDRISKKKEDAIYAINLAEKEGYFPILALSYLEYGNDFIKDSPELALQFFAYSKEFAEITKELSKALQPGEETERINDSTLVQTNVKAGINTVNETIVFSFILGFGIGLALSLIKIGL